MKQLVKLRAGDKFITPCLKVREQATIHTPSVIGYPTRLCLVGFHYGMYLLSGICTCLTCRGLFLRTLAIAKWFTWVFCNVAPVAACMQWY